MIKKYFLTPILALLFFQLSAQTRDSVIVPDLGGESETVSVQAPATSQVLNENLWRESFNLLKILKLPSLAQTGNDEEYFKKGIIVPYSHLDAIQYLNDIVELYGYLENKVYDQPPILLDSVFAAQFERPCYFGIDTSDYPVNLLRFTMGDSYYYDTLYFNPNHWVFNKSTNLDTSRKAEQLRWTHKKELLMPAVENYSISRNFDLNQQSLMHSLEYSIGDQIYNHYREKVTVIISEQYTIMEDVYFQIQEALEQKNAERIRNSVKQLLTLEHKYLNYTDFPRLSYYLNNYGEELNLYISMDSLRTVLEALPREESIVVNDHDIPVSTFQQVVLRINQMTIEALIVVNDHDIPVSTFQQAVLRMNQMTIEASEYSVIEKCINEITPLSIVLDSIINSLETNYSSFGFDLSKQEQNVYDSALSFYKSLQSRLNFQKQKLLEINEGSNYEDLISVFHSIAGEQIYLRNIYDSDSNFGLSYLNKEYLQKANELNAEFLALYKK